MIGLYVLGIILLAIYTLLIWAISYKRGFNNGVKSIRETYLRSLVEIKHNYENVSRIIEEIRDDNITGAKSIQGTKDRCE